MLLRPLHHARRNVIAYLALFLAIGAGGGYAIAATNTTNTIHGCVSSRTHVLFIQKRCHRGQRPLVWSQGFTGAGTRGISVQHVGTGTYNLSATLPQCLRVTSAPVVTVDTAIPPGSTPPGQFPFAWEVHSGSGRNTFTVYTGLVIGGSFTPTDESFNVEVPCS
jgi:hypothetical protein